MARDGDNERNEALRALPSYLLNRISHRYNKTIQEALREAGLTTLKTRILLTLQLRGPLSVNELAVHAIAEQPTTSRALDGLEAEGRILRTPSEADSRMRVARLTPAGEALAQEIWPVVVSRNEAMMQGIPEADREVTLRTLGRMLENIRKNPF